MLKDLEKKGTTVNERNEVYTFRSISLKHLLTGVKMRVKNMLKTKAVVFIFAVFSLALYTITVIFAADHFTYDSLGRLKTVIHGNETKVEYSYDKTGNRSTEKVNHIPNIPSNPDPYDGATGVLTLPLLAWNGGDIEGAVDMVTYSIYLDQNENPTTPFGTVTQQGGTNPISFQVPIDKQLV